MVLQLAVIAESVTLLTISTCKADRMLSIPNPSENSEKERESSDLGASQSEREARGEAGGWGGELIRVQSDQRWSEFWVEG